MSLLAVKIEYGLARSTESVQRKSAARTQSKLQMLGATHRKVKGLGHA
jgi:hypothetical protein